MPTASRPKSRSGGLVEKQAIQGSENSYRQASRNLNAESRVARAINNNDRIRRTVSTVATILSEIKLKGITPLTIDKATKRLISVIDGGHLKNKAQGSRSFETMIATIFSPENIRYIDKHHNKIVQKTSVASALSDNQETIKKLATNACLKEGANVNVTELTCLTDGANNCWSIALSLKDCCKKLVCILDWFHITKRFTVLINSANSLKDPLEKIK